MKVEIYGKDNCKFCQKALEHVAELIKQKKVTEFKYTDIVKEGLTGKDLSVMLNKEVTTVPQVVVDSVAIGGYTEFYTNYNL